MTKTKTRQRQQRHNNDNDNLLAIEIEVDLVNPDESVAPVAGAGCVADCVVARSQAGEHSFFKDWFNILTRDIDTCVEIKLAIPTARLVSVVEVGQELVKGDRRPQDLRLPNLLVSAHSQIGNFRQSCPDIIPHVETYLVLLLGKLTLQLVHLLFHLHLHLLPSLLHSFNPLQKLSLVEDIPRDSRK